MEKTCQLSKYNLFSDWQHYALSGSACCPEPEMVKLKFPWEKPASFRQLEKHFNSRFCKYFGFKSKIIFYLKTTDSAHFPVSNGDNI